MEEDDMKLANVDGRATIVTPAGGIDVERASEGGFGPGAGLGYGNWEGVTKVAGEVGNGGGEAVERAKLGPAADPRQVFALGLD